LLIERPRGGAAPTEYLLSNIDEKISFNALLESARLVLPRAPKPEG
jgi:hypothetical protein